MKTSTLIILGIVVLAMIALGIARAVPHAGEVDFQGTTATSTSESAQAAQTHPEEYWTNFVKPADSSLKAALTPLQYQVTQHEGTETAFHNEYWDNEEEGLYVDIVSGEPLFTSVDKFDSGTGWPSFTKPVDPKNIVLKDDYLLGVKRTEVRSTRADSHLGHLFDDGPPPIGERYCMNSAAMRFIPLARLEVEGYGAYAGLFK